MASSTGLLALKELIIGSLSLFGHLFDVPLGIRFRSFYLPRFIPPQAVASLPEEDTLTEVGGAVNS